jgi:hypothetical protein
MRVPDPCMRGARGCSQGAARCMLTDRARGRALPWNLVITRHPVLEALAQGQSVSISFYQSHPDP